MKAVNGLGKRAQCNARSSPLGKSLPCTSLPLLWLFCSSENCTSPREHSMDTLEHHRLSEIITGHLEWSSAKRYALGQTCFAGRHPTLPAGQFFLLKPAADSSRGQNKAWQCISSKCVHQHIPYHVCDSKGYVPWFSDHQSRISMRGGPKSQSVQFQYGMKCTKQTMGPNLHHNQFKRQEMQA